MLLIGVVVLYIIWRKFGKQSLADKTGNGSVTPTTRPPEPTAITHGSPSAFPYTRANLSELKAKYPEQYKTCHTQTTVAMFPAVMKGELSSQDAWIVDCMTESIKHGTANASGSGFFGDRSAWRKCWCGGWNFVDCQLGTSCSDCCNAPTTTTR